jgi:SNF family Na+-dependent transporter
VKSSGKIVAITATAPFVLLFVLMLRGVFLEGAGQGLKYLFEPRWEKIWSGEIWTDAMVQVFYQMGVGMGTLACLSSMSPRRDNIMKNIIYVPLGIIVCGLLSAVTIFVYLSHFCLQAGLDITHPGLALKGPELSFSVLPKALSLLPMANVWIFFFFITMVLLGIDSLFGMMEALYACLRDEFKQGPVEFFGMDISVTAGRYIILLLIMVGAPSLTSHAGIYYL